MRFKAATPWWRNYIARFGAMSATQRESIELALYDSMGATTDEINVAVADMCSAWSMDSRPTINDIAGRIREKRGERTTTPNLVRYRTGGVTDQTSMVELKQLLDARPDPEEARNIICLPLRTDQCMELEEHCNRRRILYEKFMPTEVDYDAVVEAESLVVV